MKDITDADYMHAKGVCNGFKINDLREYHNLFVKSVPLLLVDVFQNFRKTLLKIYHSDPLKIFLALALA